MASSEQDHRRFHISASVPTLASTSYSQLSLRQPIFLPSDRSHLHFPKPRQFRTVVTSANSASAASISSVVVATPTFDHFESSSAAAAASASASFSSPAAATRTFKNSVSSAGGGGPASFSLTASASTSYPQLSLRQPIILPSDRSHLHFRKPQHRIGTAATFYNSVSFATGGPASLSAATGSRPREEKWGKRKLSFTFDSSFPKYNKAKQAVVRAFKEWERVSDFSFIPCHDGCPDIVIGMHNAAYTAGDCPPFDSSKVLAHACLPPGGSMHFNSDRKWSYSVHGPPQGSRSYDLESVALHEIGHILGLEHSIYRDAVMYETIKRGIMKRRLTEVDIGMLKSLYLPLYSKGISSE